jgi:hypothetical protein
VTTRYLDDPTPLTDVDWSQFRPVDGDAGDDASAVDWSQFSPITFNDVQAGSVSSPAIVTDELGVPNYPAAGSLVPDSPIAAPSVADMNLSALDRTMLGAKQAGLDMAAAFSDSLGAGMQTAKGIYDAAASPVMGAAQPLLSSALASENHVPDALAEAQASNLDELRDNADLSARQQAREQSLRDGTLLDDVRYYAKQGAGNAAPLAIGVGASVLAPESAPVVLPALFGGQAAADTYGEDRARGESADDASEHATTAGVINAGLGAVPGHVIATPFESPLLKAGALALSNEAITRAGAPITMAADQLDGRADYSADDYARATAEAAKTGALSSIALGALGARGNSDPAARARRLVDELERTPDADPVEQGRAAADAEFDAAETPRAEAPKSAMPANDRARPDEWSAAMRSQEPLGPEQVIALARQRADALASQPKLRDIDRFTVKFLREHADNPAVLAEGLGVRLADAEAPEQRTSNSADAQSMSTEPLERPTSPRGLALNRAPEVHNVRTIAQEPQSADAGAHEEDHRGGTRRPDQADRIADESSEARRLGESADEISARYAQEVGDGAPRLKYSRQRDEAPSADGIESRELTPEEADALMRKPVARSPGIIADDNTTTGLTGLAQQDDAFSYGASAEKTLPGIFRDIERDYIAVPSAAKAADAGSKQAWTITTPHGKEATVYQDGHRVWLDVVRLEKGQEGSRIYNAVANYAHNTARQLVPDPAGVSDVAMKRRAEAMLSSALKFGTTDHIVPHEHQLSGRSDLGIPHMNWKPGQSAHNIRELTRVTTAVTRNEFPEVRDLHYNPATLRFERSDGSEFTDEQFERLAEVARVRGRSAQSANAGGARGTGTSTSTAGSRTLKRAVLVQSLASSKGGDLARLLAAGSQGRSEHHSGLAVSGRLGLPDNLKRVLYSKSEESARSNERLSPKAVIQANASAEGAASKAWGRGAISRLRNRAGLVFATKQEVLDQGIGGHMRPEQLDRVNGFHDPESGKLYVLSNGAKTDEIPGVVAHEVFHGNAERFLGSDAFGRLKIAFNRLGARDQEIAAAQRRVPKNTPAEHRDEEGLAYLAEDAPNHPLSTRLTDEAKLFLNRMGVPLGWLDAHAAAVRAIAALNLRDAAQRGREPTRVAMSLQKSMRATTANDDAASEGSARDAVAPQPTDNGSAAKKAKADILGMSPNAKRVRELGRGDIRAALAQQDRAIGKADAAVAAFQRYYDDRPRDVLADPRKALDDVIRFQRGEPIEDPKARPFFAAVRHLLDAQADEIRSFGKGYLEHLVEDYFPQQWKDPERAERFYQGFANKRPLAGDRRFTRQRVFADYEEGIAAGLEPASSNPVDLLMARYASGEKLLASLRIMKSLEERGWARDLKEGDRVPRGWARVNDNAFAGKLVPELVARDLNNHLDPGLSKFGAFRGFRFLENAMLSANLGLSAFHAGMTTIDTIATHADIGWRRAILLGDLKGGFLELARIPGALVTSPVRGTKLLRQFYGKESADANTAAILDMLTEGGARGRMHPTDYNDSFTKFRRAWTQGDLKAGTLHALPAALEATTRLIAHHLVPAQKMIARVMHAKFRLDELADRLGTKRGDYAATIDAMHPDTLRQMAYEINATIDDRLGQFAYDNLFWNKTVKDALHASVQSVGWNFGTLRLLLGGLADARKVAKPESYVAPLDKEGKLTDQKMSRLTDRLSYLITLNAVVALAGATLQYAMTGEAPKDAKDMFFPRTGRKNPDDSDERISFPSYVKDEWAFAHHPVTTAEHKLHPLFTRSVELLQNKDFYGTEIVDPEADVPTEAKQLLTYLGKSFLPYAVQGAAKNARAGSSAAMTALPFVGITPAPGDIARTPFQEYVAEHYFDTLPQGARTHEQAERSQKFRDAVMSVRAGDEADTNGFTSGQMRALSRAADQDLPAYRFGRLGLMQQIRAYEKASPEERSKYDLRGIMLHKLREKMARIPSEDQEEIREQLSKLEGDS